MDYNTIIVSQSEGIATICLNKPEALNTFTQEMLDELQYAISKINTDDDIRAVIITASGEKAFTAGGNIREEGALGVEESKKWSVQGHKILLSIEKSSKPYIAAIFGYTVGGGCELMCACDFIIAAEGTVISTPAVNLGMLSGWGANVRLPKLIGKIKANELLILARSVTATDAYQMGLINKVVPKENLIATAKEFAVEITKRSPAAISLIKSAVNYSLDHSIENSVSNEIVLFMEAAKLQDKKEGMAAFLEKRAPMFTGK